MLLLNTRDCDQMIDSLVLVKTVFRIDVEGKLREKWSGTHSKRAKKHWSISIMYRLVHRTAIFEHLLFCIIYISRFHGFRMSISHFTRDISKSIR